MKTHLSLLAVALFWLLVSVNLSIAAEPKAAKEPKAADGKTKPPPLAVAPFTAAAARQHQEAWAKHIGQPREVTNSIGMKMVLIPAGEYMMGSGESAEDMVAFFNANQNYVEDRRDFGHDTRLKADDFRGEHPQHRVRITKPFYLGTYHVTRGQFRKFVDDTGYKTDAEKGKKRGADGWTTDNWGLSFNKKYSWRNTGFEQTDEHPVVNVSWNDAVAFCKWLSRKEGKNYRLPTDAEWEYACRAGTTTRYYSGDDPETLAEVGNVADAMLAEKTRHLIERIKASDGYVFTAPVGKFKPNAFGLYDMHGNAWQWCSDCYDTGHYAKSPKDAPTDPSSGVYRVLRGGSWHGSPYVVRAAYRSANTPDNRNNGTGFRIARTSSESPKPVEQRKASQNAGAGGKKPSPENQKRISQLVESLASGNARPRTVKDEHGCDVLVFPKDFNWKSYRRTKEARAKLLEAGPKAFPALVAHADDARFCCVISGDEVAERRSVGQVCSEIIRCQVEVHECEETKLDCGGPTWPPSNSKEEQQSLAEWWQENQGTTLLAMEIRNAQDALKAVQRHRPPKDYSKDERREFEERRSRNLKRLETLLARLRKATRPEPTGFLSHFEVEENPNGGEVRIELGK